MSALVAEPQSKRDATAEDARVHRRVEALLRRAVGEVARTARPQATYRLQFHRDFTFRDAARLVAYLDALGVTHVYASPYLKARPGSSHGYDVVDHTTLNPELGDESDFRAFVQALRERRMGHILDFVPNHMGIGSEQNVWWQDVLENGPCSPYARFFDIDWRPLKSDLVNKVLLPVLGEQYGKVLESEQLVLSFADGAFFVSYFDRRFPIAPKTFDRVLRHRMGELEQRLGGEDQDFVEYQSILTAIGHLPSRDETDPERIAERHREKEVIKRRLVQLSDKSRVVREFIHENIAAFNGRAGDPDSFDLLDALLQDQAYRLCDWRVAADEINYRRFFDINELAAICMERPEVLEQTHALVFRLLDEGLLDGLRIDHADGLYDPSGYLWNLQEHRFLQVCRRLFTESVDNAEGDDWSPSDWSDIEPRLVTYFQGLREHTDVQHPLARLLFLVVEKILCGAERLPADWPIDGATGYEFLNAVNGLFVAADHGKPLDAVYARFIGSDVPFAELAYDCKRLIMKHSMSSELNVLGHQLDRISERNRWSRDYTLHGLIFALREVVACFPVYRTYMTAAGALDSDRKYIEQAIARAKRRNPAVSHAVFDYLRSVLLLTDLESLPEEQRRERIEFVCRFQQFTGPMMAKAVEDTAFYRYHRLVSLNEVGGDPDRFGFSVAAFHRENQLRQASYSHALLATETHDTKRGEDTRARINVLSELPKTWREHVFRWTRWNKRKKTKVDGELAPSRNDEYLLYQTLIGTWPFDPPRGVELDAYIERMQVYMTKAAREAKVHTSWVAPYEAYEKATREFVAAILSDAPATAFRIDFEPFAATVARCGIWNSLAQTLLKLTSPGVPDTYQGTELWDFSLVDPDNRRPVDFERRQAMLAELDRRAQASVSELAAELLHHAIDGRIKLFVTSRVLRLRRQHPKLFTSGEYVPLEVRGAYAAHACAFARRAGEAAAIVVVPRLTATLTGVTGQPPIGPEVWQDTAIVIPDALRGGMYEDLFTRRLHAVAATLPLGAALGTWPVALWHK